MNKAAIVNIGDNGGIELLGHIAKSRVNDPAACSTVRRRRGGEEEEEENEAKIVYQLFIC